jgi:hypothetical protein
MVISKRSIQLVLVSDQVNATQFPPSHPRTRNLMLRRFISGCFHAVKHIGDGSSQDGYGLSSSRGTESSNALQHTTMLAVRVMHAWN